MYAGKVLAFCDSEWAFLFGEFKAPRPSHFSDEFLCNFSFFISLDHGTCAISTGSNLCFGY